MVVEEDPGTALGQSGKREKSLQQGCPVALNMTLETDGRAKAGLLQEGHGPEVLFLEL